MPDWLERTIKTFVQAFFGPIILEIGVILKNGFPENWNSLWLLLAPTVAAALSAGICAVWNIINERLKD